MSLSCKPLCSSSSTKLLLIAVALIVVSVVICVVSSKSSPWSTSPSLTSSSEVTERSTVHLEEEEEEEEEEEAIFSAFSFNGSSSTVLLANKTSLLSPSETQLGSNSVSSKTNVAKKYSKLDRLEAGLARARAAIREAARNQTSVIKKHEDFVPQGAIYRNAHEFHLSYLEMEKLFKIFIYSDGDPPLFHSGPCKGIYSTEGRFINEIEINKQFRTRDSSRAHVYFLPFSIVKMVDFLYVRDSHDIGPIKLTVIDYVDAIAGKYPYWNRSLGADHFMLSCHDWGPMTSSYIPWLYKNSIRVLCNANTSEGFNPSKDVSFPEINFRKGDITAYIGGKSPSRRSILAFFAGRLHGNIRMILLEHWRDKDEDVQVYEHLPRRVSYIEMMRKSKYCLCPSGYEVASPRVVEAIYAECVPVLISDHYVPPFSDVLNWNSFSVQVPVSDIPNLKRILMGISQTQYIRMQRRVKQVQRHFLVNDPPTRFDAFHMMIHSIWLRRLNVRIHD